MTLDRQRKIPSATAALALLPFLAVLCPMALQAQEVPGGEVLEVLYRLIVGVSIIAYIYFAVALQTIARKTQTKNGWWAWIPVLQIVLSIQVARKPIWWLILCLVPFVNMVMFILVWMGIAEARKRPSWWGILVIVPLVNLIVLGILAWTEKT